eukprot:scaffold76074_cov51-Phaeocystis_antarctica.AAC.2
MHTSFRARRCSGANTWCRSGAKKDLVLLWVLAQPCGCPLASLLGGVEIVALLHLAVQPRGLLRVLVEPMAPLCVQLAESAARVLRPQRGRPAKHSNPTNIAALDALSVYVGNSTISEATYILQVRRPLEPRKALG